ncbi:MAG: 5-formyltetrahydrofolate cyclo-ligase [Lactobacillales bacterium]|jgi:5-formyltetrahydrofolate cyclo-ligase|nr:5-formyltetrahydrofolate cyclo-ligase [Lactobacillales bacterium]
MEKSELRREMLRRLRSIENKEQKENEILGKLRSTRVYAEAKTVAIYLPLDYEFTVTKLLGDDKRFVVPSCHENSDEMDMVEYCEYKVVGKHGILTPKAKFILAKNEIDLIIVPGSAFHESGQRLGYGRGYYDRYLEDYHGHTIALVFPEQMADELWNIEPHDKPIELIITKDDIYENR